MKSGSDVAILDLLKIGHAKHIDVALEQAAVRDRSFDFFNLQRFQRQVQFQKMILHGVIGSPNGIKAVSFPGPNEILEGSERA
jgi:hypothetical protein